MVEDARVEPIPPRHKSGNVSDYYACTMEFDADTDFIVRREPVDFAV